MGVEKKKCTKVQYCSRLTINLYTWRGNIYTDAHILMHKHTNTVDVSSEVNKLLEVDTSY